MRQSTQTRHRLVVETFNRLYSVRSKQLRPTYANVIAATAKKTGYAPRTVENILRSPTPPGKKNPGT
jgi:hypothetical protein